MKKQYIQPTIEALMVEAQPIMAGSGELDHNVDTNTEVDANQITSNKFGFFGNVDEE